MPALGAGSAFQRSARDGGNQILYRRLQMREIAETLAWEEESVEKIIRRYVDRVSRHQGPNRKLEIRE